MNAARYGVLLDNLEQYSEWYDSAPVEVFFSAGAGGNCDDDYHDDSGGEGVDYYGGP